MAFITDTCSNPNKMKHFRLFATVLLGAFLIAGCSRQTRTAHSPSDPLPSWNPGVTKTAIMEFVDASCEKLGEKFIPVADRVAVFDNDGTLWAEKPLYFQFYFAMDRVRQLAPEHPEWKTEQPFKAILDNDMETFASLGNGALTKMLVTANSGTTSAEFNQIVTEWFRKAEHPTYQRPFKDLVYQPMLELLNYLRDHQFKTFIVSGGGIEFIRDFSEDVYRIPKDQVVGTTMRTQFELKGDKAVIMRLPELDFYNDKEGKPVAIDKYIGRRPVFCAGNSDGDLQMMQYTASGDGPRFMLYVHHTDGEREWAYDRESSVGRLDKGLDEAMQRGWILADIKSDWKVVFPYELGEDPE